MMEAHCPRPKSTNNGKAQDQLMNSARTTAFAEQVVSISHIDGYGGDSDRMVSPYQLSRSACR
jgi:predicted DNA-binding transcriptional regulator YafY